LILTDRVTSSVYGRPLLIKDESFDLDLPLEISDDYWELHADERSQRSLTPTVSLYSFFGWHMRLLLILGISVRTIYSINRSRLLMGFVGADWEQQITNKLDQLLQSQTTVCAVTLIASTSSFIPVRCSALGSRYHRSPIFHAVVGSLCQILCSQDCDA
jgi:hypothetical protein